MPPQHERRFWSFFGNLAGSLFIVWLVDETLLFQTGPLAGVANAKAVAVAKTSASFGTTVVRGLLCNWLVGEFSVLCPKSMHLGKLWISTSAVSGDACMDNDYCFAPRCIPGLTKGHH